MPRLIRCQPNAVVVATASRPAAQPMPAGDMDGLFGPATHVNQGMGMTDEIRHALQPGAEHAVLRRLACDWLVEGVSGSEDFRGNFAMWEIGRGFTSPQARVGALAADGRELRFWRRYTIQRRGAPTPLQERVVISFQSEDEFRWQSFETIGTDAERSLGDVQFRRVPSGRR